MSCNAKKYPNGTWRIQYRWTDWTGTKKKSPKRGFKTKKEAEEWYAHFMLQQSSDPTMTLADFWEIYNKPTYLKTIHNQLSAILNYAVNFYNLRSNPCRKAGSMGKNIWTLEEFQKFLDAFGRNNATLAH